MHRDRRGWRVRWREAGQRYSRVFKDRDEAELFELEQEVRRKRGEPLEVPSQAKAHAITFSALADIYIERHCKLHKAESQWALDKLTIGAHLNPSFADIEIGSLTKANLEQLKMTLMAKPVRGGTSSRTLRPKTVNNVLGLAKKMLGVAVDLDLLAANPWARVKPVRMAEQSFDYWTPAERDLFLERAKRINPAFTELALLACHTGMRLGELGGLRRDDLDFANRVIRIDETYDAASGRLQTATKNGTVGWVPMNPPVLLALRTRTMAGARDFVFSRGLLAHAGRRLRALASAVGVKPIRFHDLRHTFASGLAMAGTDLLMIQRLCRHKTYAMTLRYSHLHPSQFRGATDVLARAWPAPVPEAKNM